jgi:ribosomal protein S18 acetylase RimI-like enzyme
VGEAYGPLGSAAMDEPAAPCRTHDAPADPAAAAVGACDPEDPAAAHCLAAYTAELADRFGFDPHAGSTVAPDEMRPPRGLLLVATGPGGTPLGCGALRLAAAAPRAEIKRLWVSGDARGLGLGRRLLTALETRARDLGASAVRLDTHGSLTAALALYRATGYREIPRYNDNPYAHHWFEKPLAP